MTIAKLRHAMGVDPCPKHKSLCPIPKKGRSLPCTWGHAAIEFADECDSCARNVVAAMSKLGYAQRLHHQKERKA